jgi:hypothetical protein
MALVTRELEQQQGLADAAAPPEREQLRFAGVPAALEGGKLFGAVQETASCDGKNLASHNLSANKFLPGSGTLLDQAEGSVGDHSLLDRSTMC